MILVVDDEVNFSVSWGEIKPMTLRNDKLDDDINGDDCFEEAKRLLNDPDGILSNIMMSLGDGLSIQDRRLRIVYQNNSMINDFGSHIGEYCYRVYENRSSACKGCPVIESFQTGKMKKALRVGITKEGLPFRFENIATVLRNEKG